MFPVESTLLSFSNYFKRSDNIMAIKTLEELTNVIKSRFSENPTDDDISLLEDLTDTYNSFSATNNEELSTRLKDAETKNAEWEQKYNDNDAMWRKKYIDRFEGKITDIPEVKKTLEADRSANITIEDLFSPKH